MRGGELFHGVFSFSRMICNDLRFLCQNIGNLGSYGFLTLFGEVC